MTTVVLLRGRFFCVYENMNSIPAVRLSRR